MFDRSLHDHLALWGLILALVLGVVAPRHAQAQGNMSSSAAGQDLTTSSDDSDLRKRARIRLELAAAYYGQGQFTTALDELKQVMKLDANLVDAFELRGLIYDALNEPGLAEDSFKRALVIDPHNPSVLHNYGWYLCRKQQYEQADELFARVTEQPVTVVTSKSLLARGVCQLQAGSLPNAEKSLVRAYELEPGNPATAYNLALVLYKKGDFERARFHIRRVNNVSERANPESLWLGIRIENKLGNIPGRDELASQLRSRFNDTREGTKLELGKYDE
jgi:type IV pilus assembly protein PilF